MITYKELLSGHNVSDIPINHQHNLEDLLIKINKIREAYGKPMIVSSGYRTDADQRRINPKSPNSLHKQGVCCDIADPRGELRLWVLSNMPLIKSIGFWLEDFRYTPSWIHFSSRPPLSGNRIFIPYPGPAPRPDLWDGKYSE